MRGLLLHRVVRQFAPGWNFRLGDALPLLPPAAANIVVHADAIVPRLQQLAVAVDQPTLVALAEAFFTGDDRSGVPTVTLFANPRQRRQGGAVGATATGRVSVGGSVPAGARGRHEPAADPGAGARLGRPSRHGRRVAPF